ncbi:MAG TPA: hypothetical protein PLG09_09845 [Syntrophomonadaceae bacterium]|nr:hypothetical protein [Syntrophomonadaceae bacterium]HOQ10412.1 hypothetical protein [Syntrophomonadaceae bacterium]HPU49670.1 hypothetical protein [Syntrophomonadaceae bacterium]
MNSTAIADIINNYKEQIDLYQLMLELARQQLELVEKKLPADNILAERHRLMEEINSLNQQNHVWQEAFCQAAGIQAFNLSRIKSMVNSAEIEELSQVLKEIAHVLQQIETVDKNIQDLLNQQLSSRNRPRATLQRAQQAYKKDTPKPQA